MKKNNNQLPNRIVAARFSHITQHNHHNEFVMPTQHQLKNSDTLAQ